MTESLARRDQIIVKSIEMTVAQIREHKGKLDKAFARLANLIWEVQERKIWNHLGYSSFDQWRSEKIVGIEHTQVYKLLAIKRNLEQADIPEETVEKLGTEKMAHLARLAKSKPRLLKSAIRRFSKPGTTVAEAKTIVDMAISGGDIKGRPLRQINCMVPSEDSKDVFRVFEFLHQQDPLPGDVDPDSDFGRGLLLVQMCHEVQSTEGYKKAEKELAESGGGFEVEE